MGRARRPITAAALGLALVAATGSAASAAGRGGHGWQHATKPVAATTTSATSAATTTVPVSFTVENVDRSKLACRTDGATYTIRGHITAPAGGIAATTASLYLHGLDLGEGFWTGAFQGASYADREAAAGHVSVTIDRLGYDSSDKPDGFASCMGGQADIAHQIVQQLRAGSYSVSDGAASPASYAKVVLHGHSLGGGIAALEAASFGDVDGLVVDSYSDRILSAGATADAAAAVADCAAGGESTEGNGAPHYAFFSSSPADFRAAFFVSTPPALVAASLQLRNRNACGDLDTVNAIGATDAAVVGDVHVPVLVVIGGSDGIYPPPAGPDTAGQFTGTKDVSLVVLPGTGHSLATEATAPQFASSVSGWLDGHGLGR